MHSAPRDWPHSSGQFHSAIENLEQRMRLNEDPPIRTDFASAKWLFYLSFVANTEYRSIMRSEIGYPIHELEQRCWQACEDGNRDAVVEAHKELTRVWEAQKRMVESSLGEIADLIAVPDQRKNDAKSAQPRRRKQKPKMQGESI